ncbi:EAL domain-containing protein [Mangrovitalea sediminis]|uniref:EAL domain-containing protein n=1 Tax=Mangrovitalea sediminis TaxID=1982043 RepID=UPI000BE56929|nr:EAL domain-containing protein [Mangrovitalea sediminis]
MRNVRGYGESSLRAAGKASLRLSARFVWAMLLLLAAIAQAEAFEVQPLPDADRFSPSLEYVATAHEARVPLRVFDAEDALAWRPLPQRSSSLGFDGGQVWFRTQLINNSDRVIHRLAVVPAPFLDHLSLFVRHDGKTVSHWITGDQLPFKDRPIRHADFVFPMTLLPHASYQLYFSVSNSGPAMLPLSIWKERAFFLEDARLSQIHALYYGFLLFAVLFNLLIFLALRESTYLYYVLFSLAILLIQASLHGKTYEYLWPSHPSWNVVLLIGVPLSVFFGGQFSRLFLPIRSELPMLDRVVATVAWSALLWAPLSLVLPAVTAKKVGLLLAFVMAVLQAVAGPWLWGRGVRVARLFTVAWLALEAGVIIVILRSIGWLPVNDFTTSGVEIGSAVESILLSLAIVQRVYVERNERLRAQQRIIQEQQRRQRAEDQLLYEATHHPVTLLPNRTLLETRMRQLIQDHPGQPFQLWFLEIKRLRDIERMIGYDSARDLLLLMVERISALIPDSPVFQDIDPEAIPRQRLASVEADTFAFLICGPLHDEIDQTLHQLVALLRQPFQFGRLALDLDPRFGVAVYPEHDVSAVGLLRKANIALDLAERRREFSVYQEKLALQSQQRLTLLSELDMAIEQGGLSLCLQPQLDLTTGDIVSLEALIRWNHSERGPIPPSEFIPYAEQTGVITRVTRWVLQRALRILCELSNRGLGHVSLSVNISAVDLEAANFAQDLEEDIRQAGVLPHRLTLELTETSAMKNAQLAQQVLASLGSIGVELALDDFGTGYSSLAVIQRMTLNEIKIDRSLQMDITHSADALNIVRTAVEMGHSLGCRIVVEGVEDAETLACLGKLGCDRVQGYWVARPMPVAEALNWVARRSPSMTGAATRTPGSGILEEASPQGPATD